MQFHATARHSSSWAVSTGRFPSDLMAQTKAMTELNWSVSSAEDVRAEKARTFYFNVCFTTLHYIE